MGTKAQETIPRLESRRPDTAICPLQFSSLRFFRFFHTVVIRVIIAKHVPQIAAILACIDPVGSPSVRLAGSSYETHHETDNALELSRLKKKERAKAKNLRDHFSIILAFRMVTSREKKIESSVDLVWPDLISSYRSKCNETNEKSSKNLKEKKNMTYHIHAILHDEPDRQPRMGT